MPQTAPDTATPASGAKPPSAAALLKDAARHNREGAPDAAALLYRQILAAFPKNKTAAARLSKIEARAPTFPNARTKADQASFKALSAANARGQSDAVIDLARPLVAAYPHSALLRLIFGVALGKKGEAEAAIGHLQAAEALRPDFAETPFVLGVLYQEKGLGDDAVAAYARALEADPKNADAWNNIGAVMHGAEDIRAALQAFDRAVSLKPDLVEALNNRGHMRQFLGDLEGAMADYQAVLALSPGHVKAYLNIAQALKVIGQKDAAKTCYWEVLKLDPANSSAVRELARVAKGEDVARLRPHVARLLEPAMSPDARMAGGYAAAYLDFADGEDERGMAHLARAGGIAKSLKSYRIERDQGFFADLKSLFEAAPPTLLAPDDPCDLVPIFIVGMPRSGTSLTEEILSRHSEVSGAGELEYLNRAMGQTGVLDGATEAALRALRDSYLTALRSHQAPGKRYIVDKMPLNFRYAGFIARALPEAKIIHLRRRAEAVCWSNYQINFPADGMAYASTQADVAAYYRLYADLMAYWEDALPGRIAHVDYDALTEAPEREVRTLLEAIDLSYEDGLTRVESSVRTVRTASALQVKQGIYKGSSEAWKRYAPWLGEMLAGLGDLRGAP
ncbi:MAG: sulfotransferase [Pseudomonadota bacterium]